MSTYEEVLREWENAEPYHPAADLDTPAKATEGYYPPHIWELQPYPDRLRAIQAFNAAHPREGHPAPDLDAPPLVAPASWVARGYIQLRQAEWVRLDSIERVAFDTGPGDDVCFIDTTGSSTILDGQEARDFWVGWTAYLAGDD